MKKTNKGRKVALVAGLALVVLSVAVGWTYWREIQFFLKFERLGKNARTVARAPYESLLLFPFGRRSPANSSR